MNTEPVKTEHEYADGRPYVRWQPRRNKARLYYSNPNGQGTSWWWLADDDPDRYGHPSVYRSKRHAVWIAKYGYVLPISMWALLVFSSLGFVAVAAAGLLYGW